jgi:multidrug transporter EmrE-like cation transporter
MAWIFLTIAVLSNVTSNMMFKLAMASFPQERSFETLFRFAFNPYLWIGGMACVLLLGCYLLALRDIGLMMSYVFVISLSMVGISLASFFFLGEPISLQAGAGMALVIAGMTMITSANQAGAPANAAPVARAEQSLEVASR